MDLLRHNNLVMGNLFFSAFSVPLNSNKKWIIPLFTFPIDYMKDSI